MMRTLHKIFHMSTHGKLDQAFQVWKMQTDFKVVEARELLIHGSADLEKILNDNEKLRKQIVVYREKIQHQTEIAQVFEDDARVRLRDRQAECDLVLHRVALQRLFQLLEERTTRSTFRLVKSYS
jgi:dynactin complex subunit